MTKNQKISVSIPGTGLGTVMFIIFMVLKLTHHIAWSWWYVTMPLWLPITIVIGFILILAMFSSVIVGTVKILEKMERNKDDPRS